MKHSLVWQIFTDVSEEFTVTVTMQNLRGQPSSFEDVCVLQQETTTWHYTDYFNYLKKTSVARRFSFCKMRKIAWLGVY
jgi:hypothetical protein